ncbi:hypothetical protein EG68_08131 [Paragonimus skrjabini miyazakii]|uniref:Uncharacterized protein n=1 Tax=Paragonimus skrjabini miyazakii TaxID=59628 RepID=A0A8S9YKB2_9TREM|nr:hypothetical protein EG68_08131 [Paragonimus skrjabini miyazakii]
MLKAAMMMMTMKIKGDGQLDKDIWYPVRLLSVLLKHDILNLAMDLDTDMLVFSNEGKFDLPLFPGQRRKSTRKSLVHVPSPLVSNPASPVILRSRFSRAPEESCFSRHFSPKSDVPITKKSQPIELPSSEELLKRYEQELSAWPQLVNSTKTSLNAPAVQSLCLPPVDWIKNDRILAHYKDILIPFCGSSELQQRSESALCTPSLDCLRELSEKIYFELYSLPRLLNRQTKFIESERRKIKLKWDFELQASAKSSQTLQLKLNDYFSVSSQINHDV